MCLQFASAVSQQLLDEVKVSCMSLYIISNALEHFLWMYKILHGMAWENSRYLQSESLLRQKSHTDTIILYFIQIKSDFRKEQRSSSDAMLLHPVLQLMQLMQGGTKHIFQETTVAKSGKEGFEHSLILEPVGQHFFFQ